MADNKRASQAAGKDSLEGYLWANLKFFGFLGVLGVIAFFTCGAVWDDITQAVLEFIFVILGGGFVLVSAVDYLYERQKNKPVTGERK